MLAISNLIKMKTFFKLVAVIMIATVNFSLWAQSGSVLGLAANDDFQVSLSTPSGTRAVIDNDTVDTPVGTVPARSVLPLIQVVLVGSYGFNGATLGVDANQDITYSGASAFAGAYIQYKICERAVPSNCSGIATASSNLVSTAVRKAPSIPNPFATPALVTAGQSPISFGTGGPSAAGSISDGIIYSGVRVGFGDSIGGQTFVTVTSSQAIPTFNALLLYGGAGQLKARWEVIQPGDPDPSDFDVVPEEGLTALQMVQRHTYTLIDRASGYLAPTGSYLLRGPDVSRLPRSRLGTHRILLRLEATGSGRSGTFYIPFLTYRIQSDPVASGSASDASATTASSSSSGGTPAASAPVKSKFTGNASVADFSKIGELDVGGMVNEGGGLKIAAFEKKQPMIGFESINTKQPKAGQQVEGNQAFKLEWEEAKQATVEFWHLEIRTEAGQLLSVARVAKKTDYQLAQPLSAGLPRNSPLRWRVQGIDKDGQVTATSAWLFFTMLN